MAVLPRGVSFVCADLIFKILKSLPTCIRERCWGFDNLVFEICNKFCWFAQEFILSIVEKYNTFILISVCVDHKDLARRLNEIFHLDHLFLLLICADLC